MAQEAERQTEKPVTQQVDEVREATEEAGGRKALADKFGVVDIELSAPFEWCGVTYEQVHLDFSSLTGRDMEAIDDEMGAAGIRFPADSRKYQRILAAKASKIPSDAIRNMPAADYNAIVNAARYFLIVTG